MGIDSNLNIYDSEIYSLHTEEADINRALQSIEQLLKSNGRWKKDKNERRKRRLLDETVAVSENISTSTSLSTSTLSPNDLEIIRDFLGKCSNSSLKSNEFKNDQTMAQLLKHFEAIVSNSEDSERIGSKNSSLMKSDQNTECTPSRKSSSSTCKEEEILNNFTLGPYISSTDHSRSEQDERDERTTISTNDSDKYSNCNEPKNGILRVRDRNTVGNTHVEEPKPSLGVSTHHEITSKSKIISEKDTIQAERTPIFQNRSSRCLSLKSTWKVISNCHENIELNENISHSDLSTGDSNTDLDTDEDTDSDLFGSDSSEDSLMQEIKIFDELLYQSSNESIISNAPKLCDENILIEEEAVFGYVRGLKSKYPCSLSSDLSNSFNLKKKKKP